jgi:hypothetical protein
MSKLTHTTGGLLRATRFALLAAVIALAGCGRDDAVQEIGADQLYAQGQEHLLNSNFAGAIISFQNLVIRYPFSPSSRQAQLDLIYAYYRSGQPEAALDVAETFRRENPRLPEVAYCLYMIGLIHFDSEPNVIERNGFGRGIRQRLQLGLDRDRLTAPELVARLYRRAVEAQLSGRDPLLNPAARVVRPDLRGRAIETIPRVFRRHSRLSGNRFLHYAPVILSPAVIRSRSMHYNSRLA